MPGRTYSSSSYHYGFNGKENDKDAGEGIQDYGMRIYDVRLGKFLSVDPLTKDFPWYTPYQFAGNKPIIAIDLDGLEEVIRISFHSGDKTITTIVRTTNTEIASAVQELWADVVGDKSAKNNKFTIENSLMKGSEFLKYQNKDAWYGGCPQTGQLTIDINNNNPTKYTFSFSESITEDKLYESTLKTYSEAYWSDVKYIIPQIGSEIATWGTRAGISFMAIGHPEIGLPLYEVSDMVGDGSQAITAMIDIASGYKKEGFARLGALVFSNLGGFVAEKIGGKTSGEKLGKIAGATVDFFLGEGSAPIIESVINDNYKLSRKLITAQSVDIIKKL